MLFQCNYANGQVCHDFTSLVCLFVCLHWCKLMGVSCGWLVACLNVYGSLLVLLCIYMFNVDF